MQNRESRFVAPSSWLHLGSLARKTRRVLGVCLAVALVGHLALTQLRGARAEQKAAKPLTTQFVKRAPRLTKPLELKKRPQPRRRQVQREMVAVRARSGRVSARESARSDAILGRLAKPMVAVGRIAGFGSAETEPQALAETIVSSRDVEQKIDMSLELVDVEALDTGRYQAMVVQDPGDKRNIKGYLHLAIAYPFSVRERNKWIVEDRVMMGLVRLVTKLNEWTPIRASIAKRVTFDSAEFFETPWVYLWTNYGLDPTAGEVESLGRYLLSGGLLFFEGMKYRDQQGERHLKRFTKAALESQGYREGGDWEYQLLPSGHPVFNCYYDFPEGPPIGPTLISKPVLGVTREDGLDPWAKGIEIEGRLAVLNTNQGYVFAWGEWGNPASVVGDVYAGYDPTLQFRFGINTIIFALTQEGSITRRLLESVQ